MIKAHQTFIGSCAPLAEKVMEMLALKNFCSDPVPQIHVPLQLLLSNVYQRITSRLAERREIDVRLTDNKHVNGATSHSSLFPKPFFLAGQKIFVFPMENVNKNKIKKGANIGGQGSKGH